MDRARPFRWSWGELAGQIHPHVNELEASAFVVAMRTATWQNRDHSEVASAFARGCEAGLDESRLPTSAPARRKCSVAIEQRNTTLNAHGSARQGFSFAGLEADRFAAGAGDRGGHFFVGRRAF